MDSKDLRKKNKEELVDLLNGKKKDLWNFRFGTAGAKVRNVKEGRLLRRDIARIMTIMKEEK